MRKYILIVILFVSLTPVYAQCGCTHNHVEDLAVLKPADVFTDNIEVLQTLPELEADGSNKVLYYLAADSEGWEKLTPPDELSNFLQTDRLQNGNFEVTDIPPEGPCPSTAPIFEFNPDTRAFTLQPPDNDVPAPHSYWFLFYSSPPENIRLRKYCQGRRELYSAEMPTDVSDTIRSGMENGDYPHFVNSHDYVVVFTPIANPQGQYLLTVYTFATDSWSESFPLALKGDWSFRELGFKADMFYFAANGQTGEIYYKLDIANKTLHELFRTPYAQYAISKQWDEPRYYMDYDNTQYLFYRYDLLSEQREVVAKLPCTAITEKCEALQIYSTNLWTKMTDLMLVLKGSETTKGFPFFVVDVPKEQMLHKGLFPSSSVSVDWLENTPGVIISLYHSAPKPYGVAVNFNSASSNNFPYYITHVSPDGHRVIVELENAEDSTRTVGIVDLETLAYTPITLPLDTNRFDTSIYWQQDGTIKARVYAVNPEGWWYPTIPLRTWIIRA